MNKIIVLHCNSAVGSLKLLEECPKGVRFQGSSLITVNTVFIERESPYISIHFFPGSVILTYIYSSATFRKSYFLLVAVFILNIVVCTLFVLYVVTLV